MTEREPMINWLKDKWRLLHQTEAKTNAEVERISALQQAAIQRRAEHAAEMERVPEMALGTDSDTPSRRRVQEAEAAHAAALQAWDDKQFRRRTG